MQIEIFTACESVTRTSTNGMPCVQSIFDAVFVMDKLPGITQFDVYIRLRFTALEAKKHALMCSIIDDDGRLVVSEQVFDCTVTPETLNGSPSMFIDTVFKYPRIELKSYGEYAIHAIVDGLDMMSIPLFVRPAK
jgi:hypothetical protein